MVSVGIGGVLWAAFGRTLVITDIAWALIWGRDLAHGQLPAYGLGPTPHPLATAIAALASPLGADGAYAAMLTLAFVGFGALVWGVLRLGQTAFSLPVGLIAAVVLGTSFGALSETAQGFLDIPVAALVVFAAVLEARTPRRGLAVLALLAIAGLQRPEVWLLAAAYWVYLLPAMSWAGRVRAAALAAAAPAVWLLGDLLVTGGPLFSFTTTHAASVASGGSQPGGVHVLDRMVELLRDVLRLPVLVVGCGGLALALLTERRRAAVPAGLTVIGCLGAALLAFAGLALAQRFLLAPAAGLAVFFGFACIGWLPRESGRFRAIWAVTGSLALAGSLATGPHLIRSLGHLSEDRTHLTKVHQDLRELIRKPQNASLLERCGAVYVARPALVPFVAYYLDRDPRDLVSTSQPPHRPATFIGPVRLTAARGVLDVRARPLSSYTPPRGFAEVARNGSWRLSKFHC